MPPESPEPGRWRSSRIPFFNPICQAFSDPRYETIVAVMGSQMGKTESMFNILGHRFSDGPYMPALYVGPTEKMVRSISGDRIDKMLKSTSVLWERLEKGHRDKVTEKWIGGTRLGFAWAGSATELASHPAGLVLIDERDRMSNDTGSEGDPVELCRARIKNYPGGKLGIFSTPTIEGASPTWSLFEEGTMNKWAWPCFDCNQFFIPCLEFLRWPEKCTPATARKEAVIVCPHCGSEHKNDRKHEMNAEGIMIPHVMDESGQPVPVQEQPENNTASFWVSGICSPWQSFGQLAEVMLKAYRSKQPERIQTVVNTFFGQLWKMSGDAPKWEEVSALITQTETGVVDELIQMITAGVDVQKNGIYYTIRGWGFNHESWKIRSGFISGETVYDDVWILLGRVLDQELQGRAIDRMFVDSGYKPGSDTFKRPEHMVYAFCRRYLGKAFPTKGHDRQDRPIKVSNIDVTLSGRVIKAGLKLWHIDTDHFKTWLYARIRVPEGGGSDFHLDAGTDEDYCKQMVAEELVIKPSGLHVWLSYGRDNHYFDCEVLARAAAISLQVHTLPEKKTAREELKEHLNQPSADSFFSRPDGSFFRR